MQKKTSKVIKNELWPFSFNLIDFEFHDFLILIELVLSFKLFLNITNFLYEVLLDFKSIILIKKFREVKRNLDYMYNLNEYHVRIFVVLVLGDGEKMKEDIYRILFCFFLWFLFYFSYFSMFSFCFQNWLEQILIIF